MAKQKLIMLGLDGAGYELIDEYLDDLPNIKKLKQIGTFADMVSCFPPVTCPNWKCYATGMNPGKLGMFWWHNISFKDRKEYFPNKRFNEREEIWDILSHAGKKVAVINMPTTYPAKKVNGFLVSGGTGATGSDYVYPKSMKETLKKKYGYRLRADKTSTHNHTEQEIYEDVMDVIKRKFQLLQDTIKENKYDFIHASIFHINTLQHDFWNSSKSTKKAWIYIDGQIGEILKNKEYDIMLMSDHGCNEIKTIFNINKWLENEGYLKIKRNLSYKIKTKFNLHPIMKVLSKIGLTKARIRKVLPMKIERKLIDILPTEGAFKRKTDIVNWDNTSAMASGQGPIYVKKDENYEKVRKEIKEKIKDVNNKGRKVIKAVYFKEEVYSGKHFEEAPDIIVDQEPNVTITGSYSDELSIFEDRPKHWKGENKMHGIFLAQGDAFKNLKKIDNISILDLAPTILHFFGLEKTKDMDGKVLKDIFSKDIETKKLDKEKLDIKTKLGDIKL